MKAPEPIIKWVGGKKNLLPEIDKRLPETIKNYYEPFFGGGAVFFHLIRECEIMGGYYLTDDNYSLMTTYLSLDYDCEDVIDVLIHMEYQVEQCDGDSSKFKKYYYDIRRRFNHRIVNFDVFPRIPRHELAAMFLFLNHTCFNGLYRVNSKGEFNVPVGDKIKFPFDERYYDKLRSVGAFLKPSKLCNCMDFRSALLGTPYPKEGDFVFLDPPYRNSYNKYTSHGFSDDDQRELARVYRRLDEDGVNLMLCNSYSDDGFFQDLYDGFCIDEVSARRCINPCSGAKAKELIITNYTHK